MKLLVFTAFYLPHQTGGYELRCRDVVDGLKGRGHEILILTDRCVDRSCKMHENEQGIHRVLHQRAEASNIVEQILRDIHDLRFIDRMVKDFEPDLIYLWHIQNLSNAILPYFSHRNIRIVYDEGGSGLSYLVRVHRHGIYFYRNERDPLVKKLLKWLVYRVATIISLGLIKPEWDWLADMRIYFNSSSALRHAQEQGAPVDGARVIHSGIQVENFSFTVRTQVQTPMTILVPGRIKPEKGTKDAVLLLGELLKRGIPACLKLVGKVQSQEYFEEVKHAVHQDGLEDAFEYLPMVTQAELVRLYHQADVCFFPTYFRTGFSRVPLEAMACGCLVITYGNEGSNEVIQNGETGFLLPEGNISAVADSMENMIQNPSLYGRITQNARRLMEQSFTMEHYLDSIEQYLQESLPS